MIFAALVISISSIVCGQGKCPRTGTAAKKTQKMDKTNLQMKL